MKLNSVYDCFNFAKDLAEKANNTEDSVELMEFTKMHSTILTEYLGEFRALLIRLLNEGKFFDEREEINLVLQEIEICLGLK